MTTVNFYPFLNLTSSPSFLAFSTGPTLRIFSPSSGELLCSSPSQGAHSGLVRLVAISKDEKWITTVADDKVVKVWEVLEQGKALKCSSSREAQKKFSTLTFTSTNDIVVGDRLGDAFTYPLHPRPTPPTPSSPTSAAVDKKRKSDINADPSLNPHGTLILGHTSPITSLHLTPSESYIITSDRDEHIRISLYPKGYVVDRFLLGHTRFIAALLPLWEHGLLLSAGGEKEVYVWDFEAGSEKGSLKAKIPIFDEVMKFVQVRAPKRYGRNRVERTPDSEGLTVTKLIEVGDWVVGLALGTSALFYFSTKDISSSSKLHTIDLGKPILDYSPVASSTDLLVSLDDSSSPTPPIISLSVSSSGLSLPSSPIHLVACIRACTNLLSLPPVAPTPKKPVKVSGLKPRDFNLYQPLIELPKWSGYDGAGFGDDEGGESGGPGEGSEGKGGEEVLSKREKGRRARNGGKASEKLVKEGEKKKARLEGDAPVLQPAEEDEEGRMNEAEDADSMQT